MLTRIPIDPSWGEASEDRQRDWQIAIEGLVADHKLTAAATTLRIQIDEARVVLAWDGGEIALSRADLHGHLDEYLGICRRMQTFDGGSGTEGLEVLDWAKKLAHDDAARALQRWCRDLGPDHATSRRLFTLLVTVLVDTTQLPVVHVHELLRRSQAR